MSTLRRGLEEKLPYSLSRWTDLPASKWEWFRARLDAGWMVALDPKTGFPSRWSLKPVDTLGMIFWTRNAENLVRDAGFLSDYQTVIHFTLTGWMEVEPKAPNISRGMALLEDAVETFGASNVTWRFSPVPAVPDVLERFVTIASHARGLGLDRVFVSFLQPNDWSLETRSLGERRELLRQMAASTQLDILVCNEDREILAGPESRLRNAVCEDGARFGAAIESEACGCAHAVDPFTQNESCRYGCRYCYAGNRATAPKKRNTTRLTVLTK